MLMLCYCRYLHPKRGRTILQSRDYCIGKDVVPCRCGFDTISVRSHPHWKPFYANQKNAFSPDFCRMIDMLGQVDRDLDGNVKALQYFYNPNMA